MFRDGEQFVQDLQALTNDSLGFENEFIDPVDNSDADAAAPQHRPQSGTCYHRLIEFLRKLGSSNVCNKMLEIFSRSIPFLYTVSTAVQVDTQIPVVIQNSNLPTDYDNVLGCSSHPPKVYCHFLGPVHI